MTVHRFHVSCVFRLRFRRPPLHPSYGGLDGSERVPTWYVSFLSHRRRWFSSVRFVGRFVCCTVGRTTTSFLPFTMVHPSIHPSIHASFLRSKVIHVVPTLHPGLGGWEATHPSVPPHTPHTHTPLPWIPPPCGIPLHPGEYLLSFFLMGMASPAKRRARASRFSLSLSLSLSLCVCVCVFVCVRETETDGEGIIPRGRSHVDHHRVSDLGHRHPSSRPRKVRYKRTKDEGAWTACRMEAWNDLSGSTSGRT